MYDFFMGGAPPVGLMFLGAGVLGLPRLRSNAGRVARAPRARETRRQYACPSGRRRSAEDFGGRATIDEVSPAHRVFLLEFGNDYISSSNCRFRHLAGNVGTRTARLAGDSGCGQCRCCKPRRRPIDYERHGPGNNQSWRDQRSAANKQPSTACRQSKPGTEHWGHAELHTPNGSSSFGWRRRQE